MANMFQRGAEFLANKLHANGSRSVVYTRGAHSVTLTAVLGQTPFRTQGSSAGAGRSQLIYSERDYLVFTADLILNGALVTPEKGDHLTDSDGTYEVCSINGEPCYRTSGAYGYQLRIHTKRIGD